MERFRKALFVDDPEKGCGAIASFFLITLGKIPALNINVDEINGFLTDNEGGYLKKQVGMIFIDNSGVTKKDTQKVIRLLHQGIPEVKIFLISKNKPNLKGIDGHLQAPLKYGNLYQTIKKN